MKIGNFSIENDRLIIKDMIEKENINIPQTDIKEFSVFCQPILGTGFLPFSSGINDDETAYFVKVSGLVDSFLPGIPFSFRSIRFERVSKKVKDFIEKGVLKLHNYKYEDNSKKIAVKITVKKTSLATLDFGKEFANFGTENIPGLIVKNLDPEIEISAPFSRLESSASSKKPTKENGRKESENKEPSKNTNANEEIPIDSKPNKEPGSGDNDKPDTTEIPQKSEEEIKEQQQQKSDETEAEINDVLEDFSETENINEKLAQLKATEKNSEDQSYQNSQNRIRNC